MIKIDFDKDIREDGKIHIKTHDIVGFYNCSMEEELKITELIKYYGKEKSIKEIGFRKETQNKELTVFQYLYDKAGDLIDKDYVVNGFLAMGELENYKDELVSNLSFSSQYCLELLLAYCQRINIVILHQMYECAWSHTIESIIEEFSLIGAAIVFSRSGQETLMKLPIHSYDLNNVTIE